MNDALLVLVSCADKNQAEKIGELLLKNKLAACVQILDHADSMFLWPPGKNQIDYALESLLLVKTLDSKWALLEKTVTGAHSYENPEIIALPLTHVSNKYMAWLKSELG